jgi:hypothetical protein
MIPAVSPARSSLSDTIGEGSLHPHPTMPRFGAGGRAVSPVLCITLTKSRCSDGARQGFTIAGGGLLTPRAFPRAAQAGRARTGSVRSSGRPNSPNP